MHLSKKVLLMTEEVNLVVFLVPTGGRLMFQPFLPLIASSLLHYHQLSLGETAWQKQLDPKKS